MKTTHSEFIVFNPETESELYYFKKLKVCEAELSLTKIELGKNQSYIHELEHKIDQLKNKFNILADEKVKLAKEKSRIEEHRDFLVHQMKEEFKCVSGKKKMRDLFKKLHEKDIIISNLKNDKNQLINELIKRDDKP